MGACERAPTTLDAAPYDALVGSVSPDVAGSPSRSPANPYDASAAIHAEDADVDRPGDPAGLSEARVDAAGIESTEDLRGLDKTDTADATAPDRPMIAPDGPMDVSETHAEDGAGLANAVDLGNDANATAPDGARVDSDSAQAAPTLGLIGSVQSTTGTALALRVQGSHVYLGDWGRSLVGVPARGSLQDYDVVDPTRPVLRDSLYLCDSDCELGDMVGDGARLFVASDGRGVLVFNLLGSEQASLSDRQLKASSSGNVAVMSLANLAGSTFLLVGKHRSTELEIYDVTDTSALASRVSYSELNGNADSLFAMDVQGSQAFLFADNLAGEDEFEIVDLSPMPAGAPVQASEMPWNKQSLGGAGRIRAQGDFVFVAAAQVNAAEVPPTGVVGGLRVIDVSNPKHPFVAGTGLNLPDVGSIPWSGAGLDIEGASAYMVTSRGLYVIDIAIPTMPKISAFYTFPADFLPCAGGRAMARGSLVYVAAFCQSDDGSQGRGGLAIYRIR